MSLAEPMESLVWESPEWQEAVRQNPGLKPFFDNLESFVELPEGIKKLRQLVMELGVAGKLLDQDESDEPAQQLIERINARRTELVESKVIRAKTPMHDKKLPETKLPSGWTWAKFGDITFNRDGERIPVRKADRESQPKNYDYYGASGVIDKVEDFIFDQPLLLIGEDGANLINRSTPIAFIAEGKYWVNNHAHVVDLISRDMMDYVALFINSISLEPYITGMAQPKMNQARMNSIPVAVPPEAEQRRIVSKVEGLMSLCDTLESHRRARESVRERASRSVLASLTSAPRTACTPQRPKAAEPNGERQGASRRFSDGDLAPDSPTASALSLTEAAPKAQRQASGVETLASAWQRLSDHFEVLLDQPSGPAHLRQSILQLAVQGKLVPQDPNDEPASELIERAIEAKSAILSKWKMRPDKPQPQMDPDQQAFQIPENWQWIRIGTFSGVKGGKRLPKGVAFSPTQTPYIYIRVTDMRNQTVDTSALKYIDEETHKKLARYIIEDTNLYVVIVGATIGKVGQIPSELHRMHLTENAAKLMFGEIDKEYLLIVLQSEFVQNQFIEKTNEQAQPKLALMRIASTVVPIPPLAEQKRIVSKVSVLLSQLDELSARLRSRQSTTDALLTALIHQILENTK